MVLHNDEDDERKRPFHEEGGGVGGEEEEEEGVELSGLSLNAVAVIAENPTEKGEEEHAAHRGIVGDVEAAVPLVDGNVGGCAAPLADTDTRREKRKAQIAKWLKYVSLIVLVLQNAGQVLTMRYAKVRPGQPPFFNTVAVFFGEVVKLVASLGLFFASTKNAKRSFALLHKHFITDWLDTLKVGVPAFIYTIQNFLLYVAIENLDAAPYMVSYQMKILTTALFAVFMLKRRLSIAQWASLVILVAGVAIVQISSMQSSSSSKSPKNVPTASPVNISAAAASVDGRPVQSPIWGLFCVVLACFLSGFAGIYFEKVLKGSNVSVWLRNVQLASLSIPIGIFVIAVKDGQAVLDKGPMQGFDVVVWCVVLLQALGGLVVAVVIKYADNILKGFATSIAIVVGCVASIFIFALFPEALFIVGAALVIGAIFLYGTFPYKTAAAAQAKKKSAEVATNVADGDKKGAKSAAEVPSGGNNNNNNSASAVTNPSIIIVNQKKP